MTTLTSRSLPPINRHARDAERHARSFLRRFDLLSSGATGRPDLAAIGIGDLVARAYPSADREALRCCAEWLTWLFAYDDLCDSTELARRPGALAALRTRLSAVLAGLPQLPGDAPLVAALAHAYSRVRKLASAECAFRIAQLLELHFLAVDWQADNRARGAAPDLHAYLLMRRHSGAVYTCFELIDIAAGIDLPAELRDHEAISRLGDLANDVIGWYNDLVSLGTEEHDTHNLVTVLGRELGVPRPLARQRAEAMHDAALREFQSLSARLPSWSTALDRDVQRYVDGLRACIRGNRDWSLRTARYQPPCTPPGKPTHQEGPMFQRLCASLSLGSALALTLLGCGAAPPQDEGAVAAEQQALCVPPVVVVDPARSLAVTDLSILSPTFDFQTVWTQIHNSAAVVNSPSESYHRLFDTNNPAPGIFPSGSPHCTGTFNGFNVNCPRQEGVLADAATHAPFCVGPGCDPYVPIGLFNRFDLMDPAGASCGEYRIVFGKRSPGAPPPANNRSLIIMEARLPNPNPGCGTDGCRPVAQFWARLSTIADPAVRTAMLKSFYFSGLPGFQPVFTWQNYAGSLGQIRTNQFMNAVGGQSWQLREYQFRRTCPTATTCALSVSQVTDKSNPDAALFATPAIHPKAPSFQGAGATAFIQSVAGLNATSVNHLSMRIDDTFNGGQSTEAPGGDAHYTAAFNPASPFAANIAAQLALLGSPLSPANIVARAQTQSCAGCHQLSNGANLGGGLVWPSSQGFTHVSELLPPVACATPLGCWQISSALTSTFLPARKANLENFVTSTFCNPACP